MDTPTMTTDQKVVGTSPPERKELTIWLGFLDSNWRTPNGAEQNGPLRPVIRHGHDPLTLAVLHQHLVFSREPDERPAVVKEIVNHSLASDHGRSLRPSHDMEVG